MAVACTQCGLSSSDDSAFCSRCGTRLPAPADPLIGQTLAGRYRIVALVGEGGMGRVYAAEQTFGQHLRRVAVKVLSRQASGDPARVSRFLREAGLASQLEHPHTVRVYDSGRTETGELFVVMELLSGETLATALTRGPLPLARATRILGQVCSSLADAHRRGVVHRDIKPDNIFLARVGEGDDFAKVLDFGIAKDAQGGGGAPLTHIGEVLGTPQYMSPEHFGSGDVDARSDIYSLGVVAFEMLTGQLPFVAEGGLTHWAAAHASAAPPSFEATAAGRAVPLPVRAAIYRALAKRARDRPQTVEAFYEELSGGERRLSDAVVAGSRAQLPVVATTGTVVAEAVQVPEVPRPASAVSKTVQDWVPPRAALPGWAIALIAALGGGLVAAGVFIFVSSHAGPVTTANRAPVEPSAEAPQPPLHATGSASVVPVASETAAPVPEPRVVTLAALDAIVVELALAHDDGFDPKHAAAINEKIATLKSDAAFTDSPKLKALLDSIPTGLAAQGKKFAAASAERDLNDALEHHDNLVRLVRQIRLLREG